MLVVMKVQDDELPTLEQAKLNDRIVRLMFTIADQFREGRDPQDCMDLILTMTNSVRLTGDLP